MIFILGLAIGLFVGAVLVILWFGNAVDEANRDGIERGRAIERRVKS